MGFYSYEGLKSGNPSELAIPYDPDGNLSFRVAFSFQKEINVEEA